MAAGVQLGAFCREIREVGKARQVWVNGVPMSQWDMCWLYRICRAAVNAVNCGSRDISMI